MEKDPHHNQGEELKPEQVPIADLEATQNALTAPTQANQSAVVGFAPLERTKRPPMSFDPPDAWPTWGHPLPLKDERHR